MGKKAVALGGAAALAVAAAAAILPGSVRAQPPDEIAWLTDWDAALERAGQEGKPIMLEYWSDG